MLLHKTVTEERKNINMEDPAMSLKQRSLRIQDTVESFSHREWKRKSSEGLKSVFQPTPLLQHQGDSHHPQARAQAPILHPTLTVVQVKFGNAIHKTSVD